MSVREKLAWLLWIFTVAAGAWAIANASRLSGLIGVAIMMIVGFTAVYLIR